MKKILALLMALMLALSCIGVLAEETAETEGATEEIVEVEETAAEEAVEEAPAEEAPVEETPVEETPVEETPAEEPVAEEEVIADEWWHILLLGGDARDMTLYERTDTMMILSINRGTSEAKMTSIMRDTWVAIEGHGKGKINAANLYGGPELAVSTVNANFGTELEDYILITMADMAEIVDLVGGVEVEVTAAEQKVANDYIEHAKAKFRNERDDYFDYSLIEETGMVHLGGVQAMAYCRDRYNNSDFDRVMRQQEVMLAIADKAQNLEIDECIAIADKIGDFVSTNLTDEEIQTLAKAAMIVDPTTVTQQRIPAEGDYEAGTFDGTWMIRPNLEKCKATLASYLG